MGAFSSAVNSRAGFVAAAVPLKSKPGQTIAVTYGRTLGMGPLLKASNPHGAIHVYNFRDGQISFSATAKQLVEIKFTKGGAPRRGVMPLKWARMAVALGINNYQGTTRTTAGRTEVQFLDGALFLKSGKLETAMVKNRYLPRNVVLESMRQRLGSFKRSATVDNQVLFGFSRGEITIDARTGKIVNVGHS
jgi:hypothetical protein